MNRPKLNELLDFVREGDIVIVESYSRLARSTKYRLFIIDKLQEKKVSFILSEGEQRYDHTVKKANAYNLRWSFLFGREHILQR